jgi:hypothetical protein
MKNLFLLSLTFSFLTNSAWADDLLPKENSDQPVVEIAPIKILPEILKLKEGQTIPSKIIADNDSRSVGASLVERINLREAKEKKDTTNLYDFYKDSEIQMAFKDKIFGSIRKGCFKNQFQTGSSNASMDPAFRVKTEKEFIGLGIAFEKDPKAKSHHIRPKYAYFVPTAKMKDVRVNEYSRQYGNIHAVFKDSIKDRTTYSEGDSIEYNLKARSLKRKADYRLVRRDLINYWEAQVWGDVCFSDVDYFLINCPFAAPKPTAVTEANLAMMKETGIAVYECIKEKRGDNEIFVKGKVLAEENLERRQADEALANPN